MAVVTPQTRLAVGLRAETFVHVGAGSTGSLIDQPVMREAGTDYPYIPGSALKGALRDAARARPGAGWAPVLKNGDFDRDGDRVLELFGTTPGGPGGGGKAGRVLISDARLAFLPLRCMEHAFVLATCPHVIERMARDLEFGGLQVEEKVKKFANWVDNENRALFFSGHASLFVEGYDFCQAADNQAMTELRGVLEDLLKRLAPNDSARILGRAIVLADPAFGYFCRRALHVRTRNALQPGTKTVKPHHLWSEESLPPETLLYSLFLPRSLVDAAAAIGEIVGVLNDGSNYLQVGGNETVGEGCLKWVNPRKAEEFTPTEATHA